MDASQGDPILRLSLIPLEVAATQGLRILEMEEMKSYIRRVVQYKDSLSPQVEDHQPHPFPPKSLILQTLFTLQ